LLATAPLVACADEPAADRNFVREASSAAARGDFEAAEQLLDEATKADPDNPEAWAGLGVVRVRLRKLDEAIAPLTQAVELLPQAGQIIQARGDVHLKLGHIDEALADFDRYLELNPAASPHH